MTYIKEITDKDIWERFLSRKEILYYPLFQSWSWGLVQEKMGFETSRFGLFQNNRKEQLIGVFQVVDIKAKRGHYLHVRHGPVLSEITKSNIDKFSKYIKKEAQKKNSSFVRISPLVLKNDKVSAFFKSTGFLGAPVHNMDAETCWVLDIDQSEDELLKNMRKTHRYLVRKAMSMNIKVIRTQNISDIKYFNNLYEQLYRRKKFVPHKGIKEEFEVFARSNQALLFLAELEGKVLSCALVLFVGNMAIYRHGANDSNSLHIPSSYLIQWEAIKEAKKRGIKLYNFWGVSLPNVTNHPWKGITQFKTGFGGRLIEFVHAMDMPCSFFYVKSYLVDRFTTFLKGYPVS